jgi:hypothetical protein
MKLKFL